MLSRISSQCVRLNRFPGLALAALLGVGAVAAAPSAAQADEQSVRTVFTKRAWFEPAGTVVNQVFGRVFALTNNAGSMPGWNGGVIHQISGTMVPPLSLPVNWKPTANGIEIAHLTGYSETISGLRLNNKLELLAGTHSDFPGRLYILSSTRSPQTPAAIRQAFRK